MVKTQVIGANGNKTKSVTLSDASHPDLYFKSMKSSKNGYDVQIYPYILLEEPSPPPGIALLPWSIKSNENFEDKLSTFGKNKSISTYGRNKGRNFFP